MKTRDRDIINQRQREFYDRKLKNIPTRIWSFFRNGLLNRIKKDLGVEQDIYELHRSWMGNLSDKKVLDLGCYMGNSLSSYLAKNARCYIAIDLSPRGVDHLNQSLLNLPNARAEVVDFLSEDFKEKDFDLIYAYGVLHHFQNVEELILRLEEKLVSGGTIISHDPIQTSLPLRIIRFLYRPFQSDREWEWPFSRSTYYKFSSCFKVLDRRAVFGRAKWVVILNLLPLGQNKRKKLALKWHQEDWVKSSVDDAHMFTCMHLSMLLKKEK